MHAQSPRPSPGPDVGMRVGGCVGWSVTRPTTYNHNGDADPDGRAIVLVCCSLIRSGARYCRLPNSGSGPRVSGAGEHILAVNLV